MNQRLEARQGKMACMENRPKPERVVASLPLTRDRIVSAALGVVRAEGLAALTMRRVADELAVTPMSLYRHVPDRQGLLLGMLDEVTHGIEQPPPQESSRDELMAVVRSIREALRADPWVVLLLANDGLASPFILPLVDRVFGSLHRVGFTTDEAVAAWCLLFQYIYGEVLANQLTEVPTIAAEIVRDSDPAQTPNLARLSGRSHRWPDVDAMFGINLARIVDAILDSPEHLNKH